ncbi:MAG: hypothetical protein AAGJ35_10375, partial [Myxococcota bacterium]
MERSDSQNLLVGALWKPMPVGVALGVVFGAPAVFAGAFLWVPLLTESYCDDDRWFPGPPCYNVEVARFGTNPPTTEYLYKVFHVGTLGEDVFFHSPFVPLAGAPVEKLASETGRLILPSSSIVSLQRYIPSDPGFRLGMDQQPPKPAPVLNIVLENSFVSVNNVAQASGGPNTSGTNVTYDVDNKFTSQPTSQETLNLSVANNFTTEKEISIHQPSTLISHFYFDNKAFDPPESATKRHILVPFFLHPVSAKDLKKFSSIWDVGEKGKINSRLQAFLAGFASLADPDFEEALQIAAREGFATPKNFLSTVRSILQTCVLPNTPEGNDFVIEVTGYASMRAFPDGLDDFNLYLAEGRRAAVILSIADQWENIDLTNSGEDSVASVARLVVKRTSNEQNKHLESDKEERIAEFVELLKNGDQDGLLMFLQHLEGNGTTEEFEENIKDGLFLFSNEEDMRLDLDRWTTRGAVKEKILP